MSNTYAPCPRCDAINRVPISRAEVEIPVCGKCKSELKVEHAVVPVSGTSLQHLVDQLDRPVVTDFWAPWCVPCRAFEQEYQRAARQLSDHFVFTSLNTMEHVLAADTHGIKTLPTLVIFNHGAEIDRRFGAMSYETLIQWLRASTSFSPGAEPGSQAA